jgi:DNA-binding NtrC family response regulator
MAKSSVKLKILYAEGDADVLASQAASMQKAGHTVTTAEGRKAVEQALKTDAFDLVILGPTLTRNDRHHLPYMVKKSHEGTRVLVMHSDGGRHPYVDQATDTGRSLESILETIASMMAQQATTHEPAPKANAAKA